MAEEIQDKHSISRPGTWRPPRDMASSPGHGVLRGTWRPPHGESQSTNSGAGRVLQHSMRFCQSGLEIQTNIPPSFLSLWTHADLRRGGGGFNFPLSRTTHRGTKCDSYHLHLEGSFIPGCQLGQWCMKLPAFIDVHSISRSRLHVLGSLLRGPPV